MTLLLSCLSGSGWIYLYGKEIILMVGAMIKFVLLDCSQKVHLSVYDYPTPLTLQHLTLMPYVSAGL